MIMHKVTIDWPRNAKTIDEFHYKGTIYEEEGGNGIRGKAGEWIRQGKAIDRILELKNDGNTLVISTIFKTREDFDEYLDDPIHSEARRFFSPYKDRKVTTETYWIEDTMSVRHRMLLRWLANINDKSAEEIKTAINQFNEKTAK